MSQLNFGLFRRGNRGPGHLPQSPARRRLREALIEALENRTMLSVSAQSLAGASLVPGNVRTYDVNGNSLTYTTVGTELFNGNTATRVDVSFSVPVRTYIGTAVNGDFVDFGQVIEQTSTRTQTTTNSPYDVELPANMTAGVNYTFNHTDTRTTVDGGSTDTDVEQVSKVITLESETPTALTVPAGTFNAYKITQVVTTTETGGFTEVETQQIWYAAGIGLVKSITDNVTTALTSFTSADAQLVFSVQPSTVEADTNFDPPVTVSVFEGGVLDTDATGTITLSKKNFPRSGTGTLSGTLTRPVVGGVAVFDDLKISKNGGYILTASSSVSTIADVDSNKFRVGAGDLSFEINSATSNKSKKGVVSGDTILYSVLVRPKFVVQSQTITLELPDGLVPNNLTGGATFSGRTITCTVSSAQAINFHIVVPDAKTLATALNGENKIVIAGDAEVVYTDGSDDTGTATNSVLVAIDRTIKGRLTDLGLFNPAKPLAPSSRWSTVGVSLVDAEGVVVATAPTGKSGAYKIEAPKGGTYTLRASSEWKPFDSATDGFTTSQMYGGKQVVVEQANTTPIDLGTLTFPVEFMNKSATLLWQMNGYGTADLEGLTDFGLFRFDTTGVEAVLTYMAGTPSDPRPFLDRASLEPSATVDPWVGTMRMMAGVAEVHERFHDTFRLTDLSGRALAAVMTSELAKRFLTGATKAIQKANAKRPATPIPTQEMLNQIQGNGLSKKVLAAAKLSGFTGLGKVLTVALEAESRIPAEQKFQIATATREVMRGIGELLASPTFLKDVNYEGVFNITRIAFDAFWLKYFSGVSVRDDLPFPYNKALPIINAADILGRAPETGQIAIEALVTRRLQYDPSTSTHLVFRALGDFDEFYRNAAKDKSGVTNAAIGGLRNLLRSAVPIQETQNQVNSVEPDLIDKFQDYMHPIFLRHEAEIKKSTNKAMQILTALDTYITAADTCLYQVLAYEKIADLVATGNFSTPSALRTMVVGGTAAAAARAQKATPFAVVPLAADAATTNAYLADMNQVSTLLKRGDAAAVNELYPQLEAAESDILNDLTALASAALLVSPQLIAKEDTLAGKFFGAVNLAVTAAALAQAQLGTWALDPATGDAAVVAAQVKKAAAAVKAAVALANQARPLIDARALPAALEIDATDVPFGLTVGATAAVSFTITNIGDAPTVAGTIELTTTGGLLSVQAPATQTLPALAAGGTTVVTWQVTAVAAPTGDVGPAFQVRAKAGDLESTASGEIAIE